MLVVSCVPFVDTKNTETKNLSVRGMSCLVAQHDQRYQWQRIYWKKDYIEHKRNNNIGQGLSELTPVEIVGCEVCEAGSPLALDNG